MREPRELTLCHAGEKMRKGGLSAQALVMSCLEQIEFRQSEIRAWVSVNAEEALEKAHQLDQEATRQHWRGPLHGIPVGIKDIIDVGGMETKGGTEAWQGGIAEADAPCVARLREAGAIILGKLVTTPFAFLDPAETRNPWNTEHTPGGSSSGSAAAVADRMCMAALGSQTGGSVLRPAAYTGLVGFKPSHGLIPTQGVMPLSQHLDHVGTFTRSVEDAYLMWQVLRGDKTLEWLPTRAKTPPSLLPKAPLKIWRMRDFFEKESSPESRANLDKACLKLEENGVEILEKPLPESLAHIQETYLAILAPDTAAHHQEMYSARKHLYPPILAELIEKGLAGKALDYINALNRREEMKGEIQSALADAGAAIMPATLGPPPDLTTTGDPRFNIPWSLFGFPAITLPTGVVEGNLPLAVQIVTTPGREDELFQLAAWCESLFGFDQKPE